ncbi:uncharacterized protein UTRI_06392 [Ustilago trichophora]|uniref:Uncharacterized protein n=1 Tax=Ustilago trichophora TaxID=86804 RepID=A0A5C3EJ51_9BASI|nr:uncharacterized protein UTRI_06392 [Ustilago trichophora]
MTRHAIHTILALAILYITSIPPIRAQQGAPPFTTDNSQPACVQFGSCSTAGGSNVATATQNAPVTAPAGTPALATFTTLDSSFISSLAAAGASAAFTGGGGSAAQPRTVTSTASRGRATSGGSGGSASGASSGGSSTMGLGGLGSANAARSVMEVRTAVMQLIVVGVAAVAGAAVLL